MKSDLTPIQGINPLNKCLRNGSPVSGFSPLTWAAYSHHEPGVVAASHNGS